MKFSWVSCPKNPAVIIMPGLHRCFAQFFSISRIPTEIALITISVIKPKKIRTVFDTSEPILSIKFFYMPISNLVSILSILSLILFYNLDFSLDTLDLDFRFKI